MRLIDVSHTIEAGLITYKGLPAPLICDFLSHTDSHRVYAEGTEFAINKIEMVGNTGTYIDAPYHRYPDGLDLADLALDSVANLPGLVVRATARAGRAIDRDAFANLDLRGMAVLVHTGWDARWNTDAYFEGHPYLTAAAATYLRDSGTTLVGIDSLNIDSTDDGHRPVHTTLLGANIPIVEHLCNLRDLPDTGFRFFAAPIKVRRFGSFPVRAFGIVGE
ncbi:MAG: cyclase family protein [Chloroflexia bacterium]